VFGWRLAASGNCQRFFDGNVEHSHFARGRYIASGATLLRSGRFRRHWNRVRISKLNSHPATSGAQSPANFQQQRLVDAGQPNLTGHAPACAVIDLATQNVFVKSPGHMKMTKHE
jgi:hypothetical protein